MKSQIKMMPIHPSSSTIGLVGYDPDNQKLYIQFKDGPEHISDDKYTYSGFDQKMFESFMASKSKGSFHASHIKGNSKFPYEKISPIPPQL